MDDCKKKKNKELERARVAFEESERHERMAISLERIADALEGLYEELLDSKRCDDESVTFTVKDPVGE